MWIAELELNHLSFDLDRLIFTVCGSEGVVRIQAKTGDKYGHAD
jgi:hypothetical protein